MMRLIRPAMCALICSISLLLAACTDSVARIDDPRDDTPSVAELNERVQAWREGLESVALSFRTTDYARDGSVHSQQAGELRIHYRDRWLWSSSIRERSSPGALPSDQPDHLAIVDGRVWQSFDPDVGWFAPEGSSEVSDEDWELYVALFGAALDVEPFPDDASVTPAELDGRAAWLVEYARTKRGGSASGSGPDGDYSIELQQDDAASVYIDAASGAPLRQVVASRVWDGDQDRERHRSSFSGEQVIESWNSDSPPPEIAAVLTEDEARRIALPSRYREPEQRRPAQLASEQYPADQGAFTLDEVRAALVRWVGGLDTIRAAVEQREYGPGGEMGRGSDEQVAIHFRERWMHIVAAPVDAEGAVIEAERNQYVAAPEGIWRTSDPALGWHAGTDHPGWTSLVESLTRAVGIDFDLARAEYQGSARLDDGRGYITFFVPHDPNSRTARSSGNGEPAREYRTEDTIHLYFNPDTGAPESVDVYRLEWDVEDSSGGRDTSVVTKYRVLEWNAEVKRPDVDAPPSGSE